MTNPSPGCSDLTANRRSLTLIWGLPTAAILLSGLWTTSIVFRTTVWTLSLVVMGGACLANARRCGRVHCHFTGPFLLLLALLSLLYGFGLVPLGPHGWLYLGLALVGGTPLLWMGSERWLGAYFRRRSAPHRVHD